VRTRRLVAAVVLAGIAAAMLAGFTKPKFTLDGYDYAIVMLVDRGIPYAQAQRQVESFYQHQPPARIPDEAPYLRGKPEYWSLFSVRRVDPWLASLLYPYRGFYALTDVSRAGYVVTAMLTVLLAGLFAEPWLGLLFAIALSLFPPWRQLGSLALTDALAVAFMSATLLCGALVMMRATLWRVLPFAALCGLLAFTRPIPYVVLGAGMVAGIAAPRNGDRRRLSAAGWITGIAAVWVVAIETAFVHARAPGFHWIVADTYAHFVERGYAPAHESLAAFFAREEFVIFTHAVLKGLLTVVPALAVAGMFLRRKHPAMPLLAGACAATWLGAIVDPDRFDVVRCIVLPIAPVLAAFAAAAVSDALGRVPVQWGPAAHTLRYFLPRRALVRNTTVKE
jgi:hypothetical protein